MKKNILVLISIIIIVLGIVLFYFLFPKKDTSFLDKLETSFEMVLKRENLDGGLEITEQEIKIYFEDNEYSIQMKDNEYSGTFYLKLPQEATLLALFFQSFQMAQGEIQDNYSAYLNPNFTLYSLTYNNIYLTYNNEHVSFRINETDIISPYDENSRLFDLDILKIYLMRNIHIQDKTPYLYNDQLGVLHRKDDDTNYIYVAEKYRRSELTNETLSRIIKLAVGDAEQLDFDRDYRKLTTVNTTYYQIEEMKNGFVVTDFLNEEERIFPDEFFYTRIQVSHWG